MRDCIQMQQKTLLTVNHLKIDTLLLVPVDLQDSRVINIKCDRQKNEMTRFQC